VPLSDHEQRLLEQMEQQLLSDDPRFASTMRGPRSAPAVRRRLVLGIGGLLVGLALLVVTVLTRPSIWIGALAFVIMLAGLVYALSAPSSRTGPVGTVGPDGRTGPRPQGASRAGRPSGSAGKARGGSFMQRLEARWERRRDDRWG
jgi:Protein of unknown function (DUF3040)